MSLESEISLDLSFGELDEPSDPPASSPDVLAESPPDDREALLEQAGPLRRQLYRLVRSVLDELEEAAPWKRLYYPPSSAPAFLAMEVDLLEVVDSIPERIRETLDPLLVRTEGKERHTLEDAEFYFSGIHTMVGRELERLRSRLESKLLDPSAPIPLGERNFVCELTADLKGKYVSALMGATASLVGEGLWSGVEVEPVLFPEKAAEFDRNRRLLETLEELSETIRQLPEDLAIEEIHRRWSAGEHVDPYALTELSTFRGLLGRLLREQSRRALYSGDYHQIRFRETRLSSRINELETLHRATWSDEEPAADRSAAFARSSYLLLEIAAVLDTRILERLIGDDALAAIRGVVTLERQKMDETFPGSDPPDGDDRHRRSLPEPHGSLVPLLYDDDLLTFLDLLRGNVVKRASLREAAVSTAPAASFEVPAASEAVAADEPEPVAPEGMPTEEPSTSEEVATTQTTAGPALVGSSVDREEILGELLATLRRLQSPDHPHRRQLAMLERLLDKHSRVPPSMLRSCEPYFHELLNELVPQLEDAVRLGAVPGDARQRLVDLCVSISVPRVTPEQMERDVPLTLKRVQRLVEALTSAIAAALR